MKSSLNPLGSFLHILFDVLFNVMYVQCRKPIQINVFQSRYEIQLIAAYVMTFKVFRIQQLIIIELLQFIKIKILIPNCM